MVIAQSLVTKAVMKRDNVLFAKQFDSFAAV